MKDAYGQSTAENIQDTMSLIAKSVYKNDRFIIYYIGQANVVKENIRFNLPGPDITQNELAEWINKIMSSESIVILDCPGAGLAIKTIDKPKRIIICAARSDQPYLTHFSEYFIPALIDS